MGEEGAEAGAIRLADAQGVVLVRGRESGVKERESSERSTDLRSGNEIASTTTFYCMLAD